MSALTLAERIRRIRTLITVQESAHLDVFAAYPLQHERELARLEAMHAHDLTIRMETVGREDTVNSQGELDRAVSSVGTEARQSTTVTTRFGATTEEWATWSTLARGDLLPVVSNPNTLTSPRSELPRENRGKVPSMYDNRGEVVGIKGWTGKRSNDDVAQLWGRQADYGICLQTRSYRAIDVDVTNVTRAGEVAAFIEAHLGKKLPTRTRSNSSKFLMLVRIKGDLSKRRIVTTHGAIEFLGNGQQCVIAGTHPSGVRYEWLNGVPAEVPEINVGEFEGLWSAVAEKFGNGNASGGGRRIGLPEKRNHSEDFIDDSDRNVERVRSRIGKLPQVSEGSRNEEVFKFAARTKDQGLSEARVVELTQEFNRLCCKPPLDDEEVEKTARSGWATTSPAGSIHPAKGFIEPHVELQEQLAQLDAPSQERTSSPIEKLDAATAIKLTILQPSKPTSTSEEFLAYLPEHKYIYRPTRELWPAASVDGHMPSKIDGTKLSRWLDRNRAVQQMTWAPGRSEVIEDQIVADGGWIASKGDRVFNLYRPPTIVRGDARAAGPWRDHLHHIYPDAATHIERWLAQRLQRPEIKLNHALVLLGNQGIGKDTLLEPLKRGVGPWNWSEISPVHVFGQFNPWVQAVVLRINEARDMGEAGSINRFALYEHLKPLIASPPDVLLVNQKFRAPYPVFNVVGVIITSNHKGDCLYLPADDRRHFVASSELSKEDFASDHWNWMWRWYENGGLANVVEYLRGLDLIEFDPKAPPPKTEAFWRVVTSNADPDDGALADLLEAMGRPPAVTIAQLVEADGKYNGMETSFGDLMSGRKASRRAQHLMDRAGYLSVRNPGQADGRWKVNGKNVVIYARAALSPAEQVREARGLAASGGSG